MKTYTINMSMRLSNKSAHPTRWIPDTIQDHLSSIESITDWHFNNKGDNVTQISCTLNVDNIVPSWIEGIILHQLSPEDGDEMLNYEISEA